MCGVSSMNFKPATKRSLQVGFTEPCRGNWRPVQRDSDRNSDPDSTGYSTTAKVLLALSLGLLLVATIIGRVWRIFG